MVETRSGLKTAPKQIGFKTVAKKGKSLPFGTSVRQVVGALTATLGPAVGNAIGNAMKSVQNPFVSSRPAPQTPHGANSLSRKRKWGSSTAKYVGKFKQNPRKKAGQGPIAKSLKSGYHVTKEVYGNVTDPHCGYIGHNTMDYEVLSRVISGAIQRKLFQKAGITLSSRVMEMPLIASGVSGPSAFFINHLWTDPSTGNIDDYIYEIPDNTDLTALVQNNTPLRQQIFEYVSALSTGQFQKELTEIRLYERVATLPLDERRLRARIDMTKEILNIVVKSKLRIQNRTKGDTTGADQSADRVDNVPVDGKLYTFKNAHPKLNSRTCNNADLLARFNTMPIDGIILARSGRNYTEELKEPPNPKFFSNCVGSSKVFLNPGDIKDCSISNVYKGKYSNLMLKLRAAMTTGFTQTYNVPGKCQLVCLEEMIRSISSNDITLVYERNIEIGAWFKSTHPKYTFTTELIVPDAKNDIPS